MHKRTKSAEKSALFAILRFLPLQNRVFSRLAQICEKRYFFNQNALQTNFFLL
jgi:hypothetical protein